MRNSPSANLPNDLVKILTNPNLLAQMTPEQLDQAKLLLAEQEIQNLRLKDVILEFWDVIEPSTRFVDGFHIDALCEHLEACYCGEIQDLLINMPPRHMKSLICSVFFFIWVWIKSPGKKFIYTCYGQELSTRDSIKCRTIIESPKFQRKYGNRFYLTKSIEKHLINNWGGERIATSVKGKATGEGADFIIGDDLHNVLQAESDVERDKVIRYWTEVIPSRGNNIGTRVRIVVMQRTHSRDIAGYILEESPTKYAHLKLSARYHMQKIVTPIGWSDPRTYEGQPLWEANWNDKKLKQLEAELGEYAAAGQLDQEPGQRGGAIIKVEWLDRNRYKYADLPALKFDFKIQSWDTAFKTKQENDFSVCITIGVIKYDYYLLDCWFGKLPYPELKKLVVRLWLTHSPSAVCFEDKANGTVLVQDFEREISDPDNDKIKYRLPVVAMPANDDPLIRVNAVTPLIQANLRMPDDAPWKKETEKELTLFPRAPHDDKVHALTHGLLFLAENHRSLQTRKMSVMGR